MIPAFDASAATQAYLDQVAGAARARSDAYFEGGYVIQIATTIFTLLVCFGLLHFGLSARMRDYAIRFFKRPALQAGAYYVQLLLVLFVVGLPLGIWTDFVREHSYGLSNMTFGAWFGDELKGEALGLVLGAPLVALLFWFVRWKPSTWWIWATGVTSVFAILVSSVAPVFIEPLFNTYKPLPESPLQQKILSLARSEGIPVTQVFVVDESRQSNRVSANVAGLFGTERIALNDNLLNRCTEPEILQVLGHEMGHYVLHHRYKGLGWSILGSLAFFGLLSRVLTWAIARWGGRWRISSISDPAVLPLVMLVGGLLGFLITPLANSLSRQDEAEADLFGLNAVREPDAEAQVDLMLAEYRKLDPSTLEEILFYDHPSGRSRILMAMRWKAEHLGEPR
ncbi:MAG: M48 family metallopeptidase [Polyangiaceae bacterium]